MLIELKGSGSTWQLCGSDNYESVIGSGYAGITYSEWSLSNPNSWRFLSPVVEESNGWAAFLMTPRGQNHAYDMYERYRDNPAKWKPSPITSAFIGSIPQAGKEAKCVTATHRQQAGIVRNEAATVSLLTNRLRSDGAIFRSSLSVL